MTEDDLAIVAFHMLVKAEAGTGLGQNGDERGIAHLQRVAPQVDAVERGSL